MLAVRFRSCVSSPSSQIIVRIYRLYARKRKAVFERCNLYFSASDIGCQFHAGVSWYVYGIALRKSCSR